MRFVDDKQLLLVVDNFEHVLDSADLIGALASGCPELRVLATSRQALGIAAEHRYDVTPMAVPARLDDVSVAEVERTAGTALFIAAARRHKHGFLVEPATAPLVARVCSRLDGLPLAVEIAAARIGVLTLAELDVRLDDALTDWGSGLRDAPDRQQTLRATIRWSYRLLRDDERRAFLRFAVFAGGATLPAAQTVCGASLETLEALQAKSLIRHREQSDGATRLVMLETLRQFAFEDSVNRADLDETRRQHYLYYLTLVEEFAARFRTPDEPPALDALDRDIDNIRAALAWALEAKPGQALRLAGLLGDYWYTHHDPDGLEWLDSALMAAGDQAPAADRARAHLTRAFQLEMRWQWQAAIDAATLALALHRESRDDAGIARAHLVLVGQRLRQGQLTEARANAEAARSHAQAADDARLLGGALARLATLPPSATPGAFERAARLLTEAGDYRGLVQLYSNTGWVAIVENRPEDAIDHLDAALAVAEKLRASAVSKFIPLSCRGLAELLLGNPNDAKAAFAEALTLCTNEAFRWGGAESLTGLAAVLVIEGRLEHGAKLFGAGKAAGYPGPDPDDQAILKRLDRNYFDAAQARLGSSAWNRLTQAGEHLSFKQAIAFALAEAGLPVQARVAAADPAAAGLSSPNL